MPNFFSDDPNSGNDLEDMMKQAPGAIKQGFALGYMFALPFLVAAKIVGAVFDASQARAQAKQRRRTATPPPRPEPPPYSRAQSAPPPPPPPPKADPLEKLRHILGVSANANKEEIKKRYRFLSHLCHPDKVAEHLKEQAEEEFKKISEAYKVLYAVAPEAPARPRPQPRQETPRPAPKPPEPKREPERPKQAKPESPRPTAKPPAKPKEEKTPAATTKENGERAWHKVEPPSDFDRPKYF
jgi:hypothetical protein